MSPLRVAVAEDEWLVAEDLCAQLEALGHKVVGAVCTGEALVALAARERLDLALVDIRLAQGSDGLAAAQLIQERFGVLAVAVTGHLTANEAAAAGLFGLLEKPVSPANLLEVLARAAARLENCHDPALAGERARRAAPEAA